MTISRQVVSDSAFDATLGKALNHMQRDKGLDLRNGIEMDVSFTPLWCQACLYCLEYRHIVIGCMALFLLSLLLNLWLSRRARTWELVEKLTMLVQSELSKSAELASNESRSFPANHLRDHALDILRISRSERQRVCRDVWPKVVKQIRQDTRIRETSTLFRGQKAICWEWIAPIAWAQSPSELSVQKTLDFESPPVVSGQTTQLIR